MRIEVSYLPDGMNVTLFSFGVNKSNSAVMKLHHLWNCNISKFTIHSHFDSDIKIIICHIRLFAV